MAKKKGKAKKAQPNYEKLFQALKDFCKKNKVSVPADDDLNLMEFLYGLSEKALALHPELLAMESEIKKLVAKEGMDSEAWGGCPNCGSNILINSEECIFCGTPLEESEDEEEDEEEDDEEDEEEEDEEEEDEDEDDEEDDEEDEEEEDEEEEDEDEDDEEDDEEDEEEEEEEDEE